MMLALTVDPQVVKPALFGLTGREIVAAPAKLSSVSMVLYGSAERIHITYQVEARLDRCNIHLYRYLNKVIFNATNWRWSCLACNCSNHPFLRDSCTNHP